jgi:hypothetical protein
MRRETVMDQQINLNDLPFLRSLCWQSPSPSIATLSESEVLQLYERNWRYRGVIADLNECERQFVRNLARQYQSWLINDV